MAYDSSASLKDRFTYARQSLVEMFPKWLRPGKTYQGFVKALRKIPSEFREQLQLHFCRHHEIWILSDLAYSEIYFDVPPPPSILQVPGAREIAIEFTSMSKTYNMPGWRIGFASGNKTLIGALTRIKSYLDYGAFTPIQVAAAAALNGPQECVDEIRAVYKVRRDCLIEQMGRAGWSIPAPPATMFAWAPIPEPYARIGSLEFSKLLLEKAHVAVSPGIGFGEFGEGYVRIALVENEQRIRQAGRSIRKFLSEPLESMHNVIPLASSRN